MVISEWEIEIEDCCIDDFWGGKEYYISDLAEMFNINRGTLYNRLKTGWDIEKALTTKKS